MKFSIKNQNEPTPVANAITAEGCIEMLELCLAGRGQALEAEEAAAIEQLVVDGSFAQLAANTSAKAALEGLSDNEKKELCAAWGCELQAIEEMSADEFIAKCEASQSEVAPSNEGAEVVLVLAIYVAFVALIVAAAKAAERCAEARLFNDIYRKLDTAFSDPKEAERAISEIVVVGLKYQEFVKQEKACAEVLKFFQMDLKKVFDPSFKLADIEKLAHTFYSTGTVTFQKDLSSEEYSKYWITWKNQLPEAEQNTLGALGFTAKSLRDQSLAWSKFCKDFVTLPGIRKDIQNGFKDAKNEPGFFGKIVRWFRESKKEREDRKRDEAILFNKNVAMRILLQGWSNQVKFMSNMIYVAAHKADIIFKKQEM